jgi:hypothetical protein
MFCIGDNTPEGSRHQGVEVVREFSFMEVVAATNSLKVCLEKAVSALRIMVDYSMVKRWQLKGLLPIHNKDSESLLMRYIV